MQSVFQVVQEAVFPELGYRHPSLLTEAKTTTPVYPRTDLTELTNWENFDDFVMENSERLQEARTDELPDRVRPKVVGTEEEIVAHAESFLCFLELLSAELEVPGRFLAHGGLKQTVCDPDRVWVRGVPTPVNAKPSLVIEYKTPWAFKEVGSLPQALQVEVDERIRRRQKGQFVSPAGGKIQRAVEQLYGYMYFNHCKYGVLSTYKTTWFFRRPGKNCALEVSNPVPLRRTAFLLEAYLRVMSMEDHLHISPFTSPNMPRRFLASGQLPPVSNRYALTSVSPDVLYLKSGIARSRIGNIVHATFGDKDVVLKLTDATKHEELAAELKHEASVYKDLQQAQGTSLLMIYAYISVWDFIHALVLEPATENLASFLLKHRYRGANAEEQAARALSCMHDAGYLHGDVKLENFVMCGDEVRIIDFGLSSKGGSKADMREEMDTLKYCFEILLGATI